MREALRRELSGIAWLLVAVFIGGALAFQDVPAEGSCFAGRGLFGPVGACAKAGFVALIGMAGATLVTLVPAFLGLHRLGRINAGQERSGVVLAAGGALVLPVLIALARGALLSDDPAAGLWGNFIAFYLARSLGTAGAWIVVVLGVSALMAASLAWNPIRAVLGPGRRAPHGAHPTRAEVLEAKPEEMPAIQEAAQSIPVIDEVAPRERKRVTAKVEPPRANGDAAASVASVAATLGESDLREDALPPADLLAPPPAKHADLGKAQLDAMGDKLMDALRTFRVDGELVGRTTGPVVTQYEIEPAPGVKVRQFANLANDLALAMRAQSIRVVAPIPGRGAVGVEVPNPQAEIVAFRELLESREFQGLRASLPIALGKDLEGHPVVADLAKMPHLLIAGATGSGKSVCVNTIITSLVYRHTPKTLRFLLVDPKMVELTVYNVLPHLRHKVVTDYRDSAAVLKWAVLEMNYRYELLAANGARNIQDFNKRVLDGAALVTPKTPNVAFEDRTYRGDVLPYIIVIIDELADLMMTVQGEVEHPLAMLAQKARAIGVHLILATQRPSVNVITGLIKANFPSRIAFRVASQVDSRTIIDGIGAEALLGNGDMLFIPPGKSEPQRIQGAYISSEETERLTTWFAARREARRARVAAAGLLADVPSEPDILETVRAHEAAQMAAEDEPGEQDAGDRDQLFREAAEVVIQHQQGSTSLLQRRLGVGYGRAARIMDQLEAAGIIGQQRGAKARDILIGLDDLDRICGPRTSP
ncbi:MAG TPA: DNA translocase FtsK [Gemmatimonadaceae bacterium]|nr:DNA translocase FtsK [Gemmatimonadaceae bacterium]